MEMARTLRMASIFIFVIDVALWVLAVDGTLKGWSGRVVMLIGWMAVAAAPLSASCLLSAMFTERSDRNLRQVRADYERRLRQVEAEHRQDRAALIRLCLHQVDPTQPLPRPRSVHPA